LFEPSLLLSPEEEKLFEQAKMDTEIQKVLPEMKDKRVLVYKRGNRERYTTMRPLIPCCKQVLDCDSIESFKSAMGGFDNGGNKNFNKNSMGVKEGERIDLIVAEVNRDVTTHLCEIVRECAKESFQTDRAPLIPIILTYKSDDSTHEEVLKRCLTIGAVGYLNEPVHMGQLVLTVGMIMKQFSMIHKLYRSMQRDGVGLNDVKNYPKFELAKIQKFVPGLRNEIPHEVELSLADTLPISDLSRRPNLYRPKKKSVDDSKSDADLKSTTTTTAATDAKTAAGGTGTMTVPQSVSSVNPNPKLNYSVELREHIIKAPPIVSSPRSVCGLSRSRVDKALVLAKLQSKTGQKRKKNPGKDIYGKSIVVAKKVDRRNMLSLDNVLPRSHNNSYDSRDSGGSLTDDNEQKKSINVNRKCSMDAPLRHTISKKAIQAYTQNNRAFLNFIKNNPGSKDFSQYKMLEIEPPYNKSSRSSHFVSNGYHEYQMGNYWSSVNIFTRAIETNGNNWLAHFWRGIAFDKVGQFIRGITDFTNSIKIRTRLDKEEAGDGLYRENKDEREEPLELAAIYFNRGIVYTHVGNDACALADFSSALKRDAGSIIFRHNRALVSRRMGKYSEARDDYVKLWMERNVNNVTTCPHPEAQRPQTMSSFSGKSRQASTENISRVLSLTRGHSTPNLQRPLTGVVPAGGSLEEVNGGTLLLQPSGGRQSLSNSTRVIGGNPNKTVSMMSSVTHHHSNTVDKHAKMINEATMVDMEASIFSVDGTLANEHEEGVSIDRDEPTRVHMPEVAQLPSATATRSGQKKSSHLSMTRQEMLENEVPEQKPVHAMDTRELTKLFYALTFPAEKEKDAQTKSSTSERAEQDDKLDREEEKAGGDKSVSRTRKSTTRKPSFSSDQRIDLNMFKGIIGAGKGGIHEEIFHKPSDLQWALLTAPDDRKKNQIDEIFDTMKNMELCRDLSEDQQKGICQNVEYRAVPAGITIFQQGEPVDCCVVVLTGAVSVKIENTSGSTQIIGAIREGEHFGDSWLLMGPQRYKPSHCHYVTTEPCQLLVILEEHFEMYLKTSCFSALKNKGKILANTGIFQTWSKSDVHQIACGSSIKRLQKGTQLVTQAEPVDYFCILTKGVCNVLKFADGKAQIERSIKNLNKELRRYNTRYSFHHSMRNRNINDDVPVIESVRSPFKTHSEERIEEIHQEISMLKLKLKKIVVSGENENRRLKLTSLIPGDIFGEACIISPHSPLGMGSIECDTNCEVLMVHKSVMQQFDACGGEDFLDAVVRKAPIYPADAKLVDSMVQAKEWSDYKVEVMKGIKKVRWPVNNERIRNVRGGTVIDRDLTLKFGPQEGAE